MPCSLSATELVEKLINFKQSKDTKRQIYTLQTNCNLQNGIMKKLLFIALLLIAVVGMSSCDYDDSNDIDVLKPNDTTQTSSTFSEKGL